MSMQNWWNDIDGETKVLAIKPVSVLLCPPKMSHGVTMDQTQASMA
jgi:hypothetical protein